MKPKPASPDSRVSWHISRRERQLIVQGLTDSLNWMGSESPESDEEVADYAARERELWEARWRFATRKQRKEFKKEEDR